MLFTMQYINVLSLNVDQKKLLNQNLVPILTIDPRNSNQHYLPFSLSPTTTKKKTKRKLEKKRERAQ